MKILGIAAYYHDSSATLVIDGKIISAAQEERFSRIKHDSAFPQNAISYVLTEANITQDEIDHIVFFEKPFIKFERLLETYLTFSPKGISSFCKSIPTWLDEKLFQKKLIQEELLKIHFSKKQVLSIYFSEHHLSHAASAFFPSPFEEAIVLNMDGVGEWATTSVYLGKNNILKKIREINFPHSLGLLYSAFTYYCGFKVNSGEYKLMGLAPYGEPCYVDTIKKYLINIKDDGSFRLNMNYFNYCTGLTMTNKNFDFLFKGNLRSPEGELKQIHMDLAASIQAVAEEIVLKICRSLKQEFQIENLCLAGGVALNCVINGKIAKENIFKRIWIQPAAGDAGGSLGAALALHYLHLKNHRIIDNNDSMNGSYLGPSFSKNEIRQSLIDSNLIFRELSDKELITTTANALNDQKAIGWFQGRAEFGPRALGNRSIIADSRNPHVQKNLNLKIKFRESFRPFAPAVLEEDLEKYFDLKNISPYMLLVANVLPSLCSTSNGNNLVGLERLNQIRSTIPAVTHLDYSARIQTVSKKTNAKFHALISEFKNQTKCSVVVNTSFNIRGEPIVNKPIDAIKCFLGTDLDVLVIDNFIIYKHEQPPELLINYKNQFDLD